MQVRYTIGQNEYKRMTTKELRDAFLLEDLFCSGKIKLVYCEVERAIVGAAVPTDAALKLEANKKEMAANYFCERREVGIINIGNAGTITVNDTTYTMDNLDGLYIGKGSKEIRFESTDTGNPAQFYIASYPAHTAYPTTQAKKTEANAISLGSEEAANERTIYQYIYCNGIKSCQLVMGFTALEPGSVWNTMPAHTHQRRTEIYMYYDIGQEAAVIHLMGTENETRHLAVSEGQAVISPMWSIHSGVGTKNYSFVWAMGGENQTFDDMDGIAVNKLK